jgi:hypothetical protein
MRKAILSITLTALVLGFAGMAKADTVELNLFDLGCPTRFDFDSPYWQTNFDLGVTFSEISHVYIDWSGEITAGRAIYYTDPCNPFPQDVGIGARLYEGPWLHHTTIWGGESGYPAPESFACVSELLYGDPGWSPLYDGKANIGIQYKELIMLDGRYIEHGSVVLDSAKLVVDGTVVPEPSTLVLLVLGFTQIIRRRSYNPPSADKSQ